MKRELKKCPFCGGEFKFDEAKEREYAESRLATGNGYAISAECEKCGCTVYAYDHKVADPTNVDQVIDLLCEKINRREGEKELIRTIETLTVDDAVLIFNEEGWIRNMPEQNRSIAGLRIAGPVILAGHKGDEFTDAPIDSLIEWENKWLGEEGGK